MEVFYDLDHLPSFQNAVITIGSFDGVHSGHQHILKKINHLAKSINGESIVITFAPHPRQVIYPQDTSLELITTTEEKIRLLAAYQIDHVVVVPFTIEFSQQNADEYIQKFLIDKFHPKYIVIGYDHRFGLNRQGNLHYLKWYSKQADYEVVEIAKQEVDDISVSSTRIRNALKGADIATANKLLGHPFPLSGKVVHGQKIGQKLGYPTANLQILDPVKLVPTTGIYAVRVYHDEQQYKGMLYIGNRPSISDHDQRSIEVNIFDFQANLYGQNLYLEIISFIREDAPFPNLDDLKKQLADDKRKSLQALEQFEEQTAQMSTQLPRVAMVILNYNGLNYLKKFLPTFQKSIGPFRSVYVADNGSSDHSIDWLREHAPEINIIDLKENFGFAEGYNRALRQVDSEYYILLNSDLEVGPNWISPIIDLLESDPTTAAAQPKILAYHKPSTFEYAGAAGGWIDFLAYPFCRGRIFDHTELDEGQYDDTSEIFWASGAAFFIRAKLFHEIGGFDPDYFAHAEEIDLCWRLKKAGFKIQVVPESQVYHVGGGTLDYLSPRKTYLNFRNTLYTILKNEPTSKLFWLIPTRLVLDGLASILFLSQGKISHIKAILKAHFSFYANFGKLLQKRKNYARLVVKCSNGRLTNQNGRYRGSIIWQYYVRGRKHFSDIL